MKCITGKRSYESKELAEEALIQNRTRFHHNENSGPINVYLCEDCGQYHFTSKGPVSDVLKSTDIQDRIRKEQEANYWESKFR